MQLLFFHMDLFPYITKMSLTTCPPWQVRNFYPHAAQWQAWPLQTSGPHFLMRLPNKPTHYFPFKQRTWSELQRNAYKWNTKYKERKYSINCTISMLPSLVYQCLGHFTLKVLHFNSIHFQVSIPQAKQNLTKMPFNKHNSNVLLQKL